MVLHGILGIGPASDGDAEAFAVRIRETAEVLASAAEPWSVAALREAARALASSPELDDKIRYGRPITPADFERVRRGDEKRVGEGDEMRVITTRSGYALKVARAKLYTYAEALGIWKSAGEPGVFSDARRPTDGTLIAYPDAMFAICTVDGQTFWRLK